MIAFVTFAVLAVLFGVMYMGAVLSPSPAGSTIKWLARAFLTSAVLAITSSLNMAVGGIYWRGVLWIVATPVAVTAVLYGAFWLGERLARRRS